MANTERHYIHPLPYVNGLPEPLHCAQCGTELGNERAAARDASGRTKFFCKQEPGENPQDSCYLQWRMRHH